MIDNINNALDCKNDSELAKKIGIDKSRVSRWRNVGFHKSTGALVVLLLEKIKEQAEMETTK